MRGVLIAAILVIGVIIVVWRVVRTNERRRELAKLRKQVKDVRVYALANCDIDPTARVFLDILNTNELETK